MITETTNSPVLPTKGGKIRRPSFKSRVGSGQHVNRTGSFKGYQTIRVSVPSSMVEELASKFNAIIVDANQGDSMKVIMKKVNETLDKDTMVREKGAEVLATEEKFELTSQKKRCINKMVVVRTNSNQQEVTDHLPAVDFPTAIKQPSVAEQRKVFDHLITAVKQPTALNQQKCVDNPIALEQRIAMLHPTTMKNPTAKQRKIVNQWKSSSVVKNLLMQFENGENLSNPSVPGPKQNVTTRSIRRNERKPLLQKDMTTVDRHLLNKDKRLSIARDPDAQLESVLNAMPPLNQQQLMKREPLLPREDLKLQQQQQQQEQPTERERSPLRENLEQQQSIETDRSLTIVDFQQPSETAMTRSPPPLPIKPNCSFLHGWKRKTITTTTAVATATPTTTTTAPTIPTNTTPSSTISTTTALATTTPVNTKGGEHSIGEVRSTTTIAADTTFPTTTTPIASTPITNTHTTIIPAETTLTNTTTTAPTSTTKILATTTPVSTKGGEHSDGEVRSTELLSSLVDGTPVASLAEATLTAFAIETTTSTTDPTAEVSSHNYNYIVGNESIYEELRYIRLTSTDFDTQTTKVLSPNAMLESPFIVDCTSDDHYTTIDGGEQNIYDVVTTTAYEDTSYETVQPPLPPLLQLPVVSTTVVDASPPQLPVNGDGDKNGHQEKKEMFDNSVEIYNSIYGFNPPSESTSSGVTSDSASMDRNSKFDDDDWVDVPSSEEIILIPYPSKRFRQKPKIKKPKPKSLSNLFHGLWYRDHISISSQSVISFIKDVPEQFKYKKNPCDFLSEQLLSVVLKTVFLEEKFESQELSLFFDNDIGNTINQEIPENIYVDDSFSSDNSSDDDEENVKRVPDYPCKDRVLPAPPSDQRNYLLGPLVNKARKQFKKGFSFGSLRSLGTNRIRKLSQGNLTAEFDDRTYESTSDKSNDNKFSPLANSNLSSSVFYIPLYKHIIENGNNQTLRVRSRPPSSTDSRRQSVARPSSPPPPPPVKRNSTGNTTYDSLYNSKGRSGISLDKSSTESTSENGSNHGSDLYMRFADEPLYQFYAADISERTKSVFANDIMEDCDGYEEISSITSRPSALDLITPCTVGHGQLRSLWCEVPEVKNSGIIDSLTLKERKLQEAKFELITSEASYFKSLTVLEKHFINSHSMNDDTILSKKDQKILFGNVNLIRKCSEKLLAALEKCWQDNILLNGLSEILCTHSQENFDIFVKYCSNQIYIDRTLKSLRENQKFNEALQRLESDPKCQSLSLYSFLMLPMQRITRLPLLVNAILLQMDSKKNFSEYKMCKSTLDALNAIVKNCNESTRKLERYEEMLLISQQLEFSSKKEMKAMSVASSSRWLVRSGSMLNLTVPDAKSTFSRKLIRPTKLYFFLFNDMFFIAKRKSDGNYTVVDYCARNFVEMVHTTESVITSSYKNLLKLTILENHEAKTIEMLLSCDSESSKKRWIEAMSPPISSNPEETLYNEWDCPQVFSEHPYTAIQPDELSLKNGDIVKVLTKMNDGWYHGERIRDGEKGWFPGNYTSEIASQHARAKNLKQRYHLLAMSGSYLQSRQDKIKKKKSIQII